MHNKEIEQGIEENIKKIQKEKMKRQVGRETKNRER